MDEKLPFKLELVESWEAATRVVADALELTAPERRMVHGSEGLRWLCHAGFACDEHGGVLKIIRYDRHDAADDENIWFLAESVDGVVVVESTWREHDCVGLDEKAPNDALVIRTANRFLLVSSRCPSGDGEIALGQRLHVVSPKTRLGSTLTVRSVVPSGDILQVRLSGAADCRTTLTVAK